jgi:DNA invertase Pin-like site-specific DNA recombinase
LNLKSNTGESCPEPSDRFDEARPVGRRRVTKRDQSEIVELYELGLSTRQIAIRTGLARTTVLNRLKRTGVEMRPRGNYPGR